MSTISFSPEITWPKDTWKNFDNREGLEDVGEVYECPQFKSTYLRPRSPLYQNLKITLQTKLTFMCFEGHVVVCPLGLAFRECATIREAMESKKLKTVKDTVHAPGIFDQNDAAMLVFFMHEGTYPYQKGSKDVHEELVDNIRMLRAAKSLGMKSLETYSDKTLTELVKRWSLSYPQKPKKKARKHSGKQTVLPPITATIPKPVTAAEIPPVVAPSIPTRAQRPKLTIKIPHVEPKVFPIIGTIKMNYLDFVLPASERRPVEPQSAVDTPMDKSSPIAAPAPKRRRLMNGRGQPVRA